MALVRIFLPTCRRAALLARALASLRAQTFQDWICELHNDAPEDDQPRRLATQLNDPRVHYHHHDKNWGPVAMFNHAFSGGPEPFLALLEDDNWWEPDFLSTALSALHAHPTAAAAWANLRIWREEADGEWTDTGRAIWRTQEPQHPPSPRLLHWPQPLQCFDALHSNGAMLVRTPASRNALVPADLPFAVIEPARERLLAGGWLLLPQILGHYALTRQTARERDRAAWTRAQLLVAASYLLTVRSSPEDLRELWRELREQTPPSTGLLFNAALSGVRPFALLRHARPIDWLRFLAGAARHPRTLARGLRFRSRHPEAWRALLAGARARTAEAADAPRQTSPVWQKILAS